MVWRKLNTDQDPTLIKINESNSNRDAWRWVDNSLKVASGVRKFVFIGETMDKIIHLNILKSNLKYSAAKRGLG